VTPTTAVPRRPFLPALLIACGLVLGLVLGSATSAQAHTELTSSDPADGSTVTAPVDAVVLTFSGSVLVREVTVVGPESADVTADSPSAAGAVVSQPVRLTDAGLHTLTYAVTSSDGHVVEGTLSFTYAPPSPTTAATTPATTAPAGTSAPAPATPSEAAAESPTSSSAGLLGWALAAGAALVVALAVALLVRRRARR
jgi:methionine-rich copper-binding protein CopC